MKGETLEEPNQLCPYCYATQCCLVNEEENIRGLFRLKVNTIYQEGGE